MPKKLKKPKSKMFANCKLNHYYSVIGLNDINGNLKYYQVQKNRKKIGNYQNLEVAIRHMMSEANYELQDLFTQNIINDDYKDGETIRFINHEPHYYKKKKVDYNTTIDFAGGQYYLLKEYNK